MKPNEIQRLIELVERSQIHELEVSRWWKKVRIRKHPGNNVATPTHLEQLTVAQSPAAQLPASAPTPVPSVAPAGVAVEDKKQIVEIRSPMVGTFYRAPAPDAAPYVDVGNTVTQGQVLCIIEAMKLMNEIEAEFPCRILEILVENAQPVEYNQPLFRVDKI